MKLSIRGIVLTIFSIVSINSLKAQSCDPILRPDSLQYWFIGGSPTIINQMKRFGNTMYICGAYSFVGKYTGRFIGSDTINGKIVHLGTWPKVDNGSVYCSISDGNGGIIIGGNFSSVNGQARGGIAQIDANGNLTTFNPIANNSVRSLLLTGTTLYAGGDFTQIGAQTRNHLAGVDMITGAVTAWNPNVTGSYISALAVFGSTIYVVGAFSNIGAQPRSNIAALDAYTGNVKPWNPGITGNEVCTIGLDGSFVYVGGRFTIAGGQPRNSIAAIDTTTGLATSWNPNASNYVRKIIVSGSNVYAVGDFTSIGNQTRHYFAELSAATGNATALDYGISGVRVRTMVLNGDKIYIGGDFNVGTYAQARYNIAKLDITTGTINNWDCQAVDDIYTLLLKDDELFAGGDDYHIGSKRRHGICAYDLLGDSITSWNPCPNYSITGDGVYSVTVRDTAVYFGGDFTSVAGTSRTHIAAVNNTSGAIINAWNPGVNNVTIYDLSYANNKLYLAGTFSQVAATSRSNLAAVDAFTGAIKPWNPASNGSARSLLLKGDSMFVAGSFTNIAAHNQNGVAAVDTINGSYISWNADFSNGSTVYQLRQQDDSLYAGGSFSTVNNIPHANIVSLNINSAIANPWNPNPNLQVYSFYKDNNLFYCSGRFTTIGINAVNRQYMAIVEENGSARGWNPSPTNYNIYGTEVFGSTLFVGGNFTSISGSSPGILQSLASYTIQTVPPTCSIAGDTAICIGTTVTYTATTNVVNATYQWLVNNVNQGTNSTYTYTPQNNDQVKCVVTIPAGSCYTAQTDTSNVITMTVTPYTTPTISISGNTTMCAGTQTTYTATTNIVGGTYQWKVNNIDQGTGSTYTYTPQNNDQVVCELSTPAGCYQPTSVTSNTLTITVNPVINATGSITTANTSVCAGTSVTIDATTNIAGCAYQWQVNNVNAGSNLSSYTYTPSNNDNITCIISAPVGSCYSPMSLTSNTITMTVTPNTVPDVTISGNNTVCTGSQVTYTATGNVAGASYQWQVNNTNAGSNQNTYSYIPANTDLVRCIITTPPGCYTPTTDTSNEITMIVNPILTPVITISGPPSAHVGDQVNLTASISNGGPGYSINWKNNNVSFATTTVPNASYTKGPGSDNITAVLTTQGCYTVATSNTLIIAELLGVEQVNFNNKIEVYPNPFGDIINVMGLEDGAAIVLYDMLGNTVKKWNSGHKPVESFSTGELAQGIYLLRITAPSGTLLGQRAIVKH